MGLGATVGAPVVPALRYRDTAAAVDWLCQAFGFERHAVELDRNGSIAHARLTFGSSMIMIDAVERTGFGRLMRQPDEVGHAETQSCYLIVGDVDQHCAAAKAAGASIVVELGDFAQGGRGYSCRDIEGHIWTFGSFDPWQGRPLRTERHGSGRRAGAQSTVAGVLAAIAVVASIAGVGLMYGMAQTSPEVGGATPPRDSLETRMEAAREELSRERSAREAAQRLATEMTEEASKARVGKEVAELAAREAQALEAKERVGREIAERAGKAALEQQAKERSGREAAELVAGNVLEQLAKEISARDAAERTARQVGDELVAEQAARKAAEPAAGGASGDRSGFAASEREATLRAARLIGGFQSVSCALQVASNQNAAASTSAAAGKPGPGAAGLIAAASVAAELKQAREQASRERTARETAERAVRAANEQLAQLRAAVQAGSASGGRYDSLTSALLCQR